MKNIIKRGTSLLLVLAMLLSFAAVVGAADERLPAEGEKPVTLSLDSVVLRQGSTDVQYVPVRLTIEPGFAITGFQLAAVSSDESAVEVTGFYPKRPLKIYEDGSVNYDETIGTIFGKLYSNYGSSESKDPVQKFACANGKGVTSETISTRAEDGVIKEPDLAGYIGVKVKDGAQSGAYQLSIIPNASRDRDTTKRNDIVFTIGTQNTYTDAYATLNAGTAIVLPEGVNLPTVILTDDTFAVPTWEQMQAKQDKYPLASRMKIVGNDNKLYDVDAESLVVSAAETLPDGVYLNDGKTLELATRAEANTTGISLTVKSAKAVDADISISAPATVTAKISKADRGVWKAGFATNAGYYVTDTSFEKSYSAPEYKTPEEAYKYLSLNPSAIDYYGKKVDNYGVTSAELEIYSDAQHQNRITTGDVLESVKFTDENCNSLKYGSLLKQDVWCRVRAVVTVDENTKLYGDWLEFQIVNKYPQAASATVVLGDMNGNEFPSGPVTTIDIPYGTTENKTFSIIVKDFRQADGKTMPEGTEPSATDVTIALDGTYTGVSISNDNKLVIDKTAQAGTVTVKATLNGKELGTLTLTLQKAASVVTELKLYDRATGKPKDGTEIEIKSGVTNGKAILPGIRANDELVLEFEPVCAIDQYGDIVQTKHAVDGGYANRDYLSTLDYVLYKYDETAKEYKTFTTNVVRTVDTTTGVLKLTLKNELDKDTNELLIPEGKYCLKTWAASFPNGVTMLSSAEFELVKGASVYDTLEVTADETSVKVPYAYGTTEQTTQQYLTLTVNAKDQYGRAIDASKITDLALDESTVWVGGNAIGGILPVAKDQHTTTASNVLRLEVKPSAGENMKTNLTADLEVALTFKVDGTAKRIERTKVTTLTKDESVLSTAAVRVGETAGNWNVVDFYSNVMLAKKEQTVNLIAPKDATKSYKISILNCDQYGTKLDGQQYEVTAPEDGSIAIVDQTHTHDDLTVKTAAANKELVISFPNAATPTWKVTIKVVPMEFVKSETGKNDTFKLGDYLTNGTFSAEYNGDVWRPILAKKDGAKVYIKTAEGDNTLIDDNKLSLEVTKDGSAVDQTQKANAGTYKVKLVYTDAKGQKYTVDEKTFTITPKPITIGLKANETIEKEYDGTANLPDDAANKLELNGVVENDGVSIDTSMLEFASANAGEDIAIRLKEADANCLKTASGEPATNYTADLSKLKGTITARRLTVTPNERTFTYGQDTEINAALAREYTVSNNLEGAKAAKITGSMKLTTTSGADVTVYNAGTYNVVNNNLSAGTNYEIEFPATPVQWTISKKSVDPFNVTLEADFGVYGSELYAMLNTAKVTVDGQQVNLSTLYNVEALYIKGVDGNNVPKTDALVNAGEYTVTSLPATTLGTANYEFKTAPTLKINVKPHVLADADVQLSGDDGATFDGTEKSVMVKVSFTYGGREVTLTKDTDYTLTGTVKTANAGGHYLTVTAKPNGNLSGSVQKDWQIWSYSISPSDITFKQTSTSSYTYNGSQQELQKSDVTWTVTTTDTTKKAFLKQYFAANDFYLHDYSRTDAGNHTAIAMLTGNFVATKNSGPFTIPWKIKQSKVHTISDQTPSTKYGQPGSLTVTLSEGQYKGLTNGAWTVRDIGDIFESAVAEYKDGVVTINWKLKDTTKAGDTGSFKVTVPASTNYEGYEFTVTVNVTAKDAQTGFGFTYANPIVGYAEDTYTNPVQNAKTTPEYTSSKPAVATVDSNGVVTILDVGETVITANAPENGEYASATDSYTLTVVPSTLTVTASSATMTANDPVPSFAASVTGLKRGQTTAQVFQTLTASAATDGKTAGTYAVNASATLKTDFVPRYTLRFVPGTLTVNPAQTAIDVVLPIIIGGNTCANGYANCACESFYDLDASRWYHEAIDWAYSLGLMNGTTKSTFGPNAAATRAQTWTMLARIAGQDTRRSSTWYEVGQKWAMNLGITDGTNPMGSLTREQLAAMLYRYVGSPAVNGTLTFTDSANVSTWARNAMIWAVQNGILDGVGGNRLNPKGTTTRAQAAAIFMRFSKLINK